MSMNLRIASWQSPMIVSTDPKPVGEGDAIHVQHIKIAEKPNYWTNTEWGWVKSLYDHQQCKIVARDMPLKILWSI